ncbi:MAG: gliding motility protein GldM [Schleiferiaceae bacterium]|nr:gliding motility protein GldM [Schleiferiaceae bacterium]
MAGGKLSPRQKMINMMYLVLTALLALNVSREILDAIDRLDDGLNRTISTVDQKNQAIYMQFEAAAAENKEKAGPWRDKALEVKAESDRMFQYVESVKQQVVEAAGGRDEKSGKLTKADNTSIAQNYLVSPKETGGKGLGADLRNELSKHREFLLKYVSDNEVLTTMVSTALSTEKEKMESSDLPVNWEVAKFGEFPLAAVVAFLTEIQSNIRNMESQTIEYLQINIGKADLKFTDVKALTLPRSTYVNQGDVFEADIMLAAYDATQTPGVIVNGKELPAENIKDGIATVRIPASSVGEQKWGGIINIRQNGQDIPFEFSGTYTVAPPSVVISPTAMNVFYRGVDNPIEISVPGVDPSKISASGPGIKKVGNGYIADVTSVSGLEMEVNVTVQGEDGRPKPAGKKKFRIKGLPPPTGKIYNRAGGTFSASAVSNATILAVYDDFPFDLNLEVTSFDVAIPGSPPITVRGNKMDGNTRDRIQRLRPNSTLTIRNIKAKGPKGPVTAQVSPIVIDIN